MRSVFSDVVRAPSGRETARRGRPLTKTEEEESIIFNRPDRSTYPEQKSVSRSGATRGFANIQPSMNRKNGGCLHGP